MVPVLSHIGRGVVDSSWISSPVTSRSNIQDCETHTSCVVNSGGSLKNQNSGCDILNNAMNVWRLCGNNL